MSNYKKGMHLQEILRTRVIKDYYNRVYKIHFFDKSFQRTGTNYFEKKIERNWIYSKPRRVLEIGGGQGEHLHFVNDIPTESYISLDLVKFRDQGQLRSLSADLLDVLEFQQGNAENLPFEDETFDRVVSTCLLHHVDNVLAVLYEAKRVTKIDGEIRFGIPTDPGVLNHFIKRFYSYQRMRKLGIENPKLIYALEHRNHIWGILQLVREVFKGDELKINHHPFRIPSWNFNLMVVVSVKKRQNG